jgi:hypothetical protein
MFLELHVFLSKLLNEIIEFWTETVTEDWNMCFITGVL